MPEQWEHQALRTYRTPNQNQPGDFGWAQLIRPDGSVQKLEGFGGSIGDGVVVLNRLAAEGWHLVATEMLDEQNSTLRVFWLRRRMA